MAPEEVLQHPAQPADEEFLLSVYASTRAQEMAQVPWSAEQKDAFVRMQFTAQLRHYAAEFPAASHEVISWKQVPVGRIYFSRNADEIHILDITVLPQHRKAGIASLVVRRLLEEASTAAKPVSIYVESFNPSMSFFRQLGFQPVAERGFHVLLRWTPGA